MIDYHMITELSSSPEVQLAALPLIAKFFISFILTSVLGKLMRKKPEPLKAPQESDLQYTTAEQNRSLPMVFGTIKQPAPNIIAAGEFGTTDVLDSGITVARNFFYGMQYALAQGPIDAVTGVWVNDRKVWPYSDRAKVVPSSDSTANDPVAAVYSEVSGPNQAAYYRVTPTGPRYPNSSSAQAFEAYGTFFVGTSGTSGVVNPNAKLIEDGMVSSAKFKYTRNGNAGYYPTYSMDFEATKSGSIALTNNFGLTHTSGTVTRSFMFYALGPYGITRQLEMNCDVEYVAGGVSGGTIINTSNGAQQSTTSDAPGPLTDVSGKFWPTSITSNPEGLLSSNQEELVDGDTIYVRDRALFDNDASPGGQGGMEFFLTLSSGEGIQSARTYYAAGIDGVTGYEPADRPSPFLDVESGYPGVATLTPTFTHNYYGRSPQLPQILVELQRFPDNIGMPRSVSRIGGFDANPALVIHEALTDTNWGLSFPPGQIDEDAFRSAAALLATEGHGYSRLVDTQTDIDSLIQEIEAETNCFVYMGRDGRWTIRMIRDDYARSALRTIGDSNIIDVQSFSRSTYDDPINSVTASFLDRAKGYQSAEITAFDQAALSNAGQIERNSRKALAGVTNEDLAMSLARREVQSFSVPQARASLVLDRSMWDLEPGQPVLVTSSRLALDNMVMRVTNLNFGTLEDGKVTVTLLQDIFSAPAATSLLPFSDLVEGTLQDPVSALEATEQAVIEAPRFLVDRSTDTTDGRLAFAGGQVSQMTSYRAEVDSVLDRSVLFVSYPARLTTDLGKSSSGDLGVDLVLDCPEALAFASSFVDGPDHEALDNLILVGDELMLVTSATATGDQVVLRGIYRGALDTVSAAHSSGDSVFRIKPTSSVSTAYYSDGASLSVELLPQFGGSGVTAGTGTSMPLTMAGRYWAPLPPSNMLLDGESFATTPAITQGERDLGLRIDVQRRSWRTSSVIDSLSKDIEEVDPGHALEDNLTHTASVYAIDPRTGERAAYGSLIWEGTFTGQVADVPWSSFLTAWPYGQKEQDIVDDGGTYTGNPVDPWHTCEFEVEISANHAVLRGGTLSPADSLQTVVHRFEASAISDDVRYMTSAITGSGYIGILTSGDYTVSLPLGATTVDIEGAVFPAALATVIAAGDTKATVTLTEGDDYGGFQIAGGATPTDADGNPAAILVALTAPGESVPAAIWAFKP